MCCNVIAKLAKEAAMQRIKIIIRRNNCILFWKTILQQFKDNAAVYIYTADAFKNDFYILMSSASKPSLLKICLGLGNLHLGCP